MRDLILARLALASALALGALLGSACQEEPNRLEGSIIQNFDLDFDDVRLVRINGSTFQLEYLFTLENGGQNVICKIVFDEPEGGVQIEEDLDILALDGKVERVAGDGDFPDVESGVIRFFEGGQEAGPAVGEFAITFTDGKTLNGAFETTLEDVEL